MCVEAIDHRVQWRMASFDRQTVQSLTLRWGGLTMLALAGLALLSNASFWLRAEVASGVVVGSRTVEYASGSRTPTVGAREEPVVSFTTKDGEAVDFQASERFAFGGDSRNVGDEVSVLYPRTEPTQAKLRAPFAMFFVPALFMAFGVGLRSLGEWLR